MIESTEIIECLTALGFKQGQYLCSGYQLDHKKAIVVASFYSERENGDDKKYSLTVYRNEYCPMEIKLVIPAELMTDEDFIQKLLKCLINR